jgi:hypothetical protein
MSKERRIKRFEIARDDGHLTYLDIHSSGSFMVGEFFKSDATSDNFEYHAVLSIRPDEAPRIIEILSDEKSWTFEDTDE